MTNRTIGHDRIVSNQLTLTSSERHAIASLAKGITKDPSVDPESFCKAASSAAWNLPNGILDSLYTFKRYGSDTGAMVISGMPIGPVPATPQDNQSHLGEKTLLARAQAIINEAIGSMVAYEAEGYSKLFQDMVPSRLAVNAQSSLGSSAELELHTEQAFSALRPDFISLACLRGDPSAKTYTFTARRLVATVTSETLAALRRKCWMTGIDESFLAGGFTFDHGVKRGPLPILSGAPDDPFIIFDQDLMTSMEPEAAPALNVVIDSYRRVRDQHVLMPGDLLLIDNQRAVHGRSPFLAQFDGSDRFVIRSFVTTDLARSRYARSNDSRTIAARFS
jgi:L-asparagine oxygenase